MSFSRLKYSLCCALLGSALVYSLPCKAQVSAHPLHLEGISAYTREELKSVAPYYVPHFKNKAISHGEHVEKTHDVLVDIAGNITNKYKSEGYPATVTVVPEQDYGSHNSTYTLLVYEEGASTDYVPTDPDMSGPELPDGTPWQPGDEDPESMGGEQSIDAVDSGNADLDGIADTNFAGSTSGGSGSSEYGGPTQGLPGNASSGGGGSSGGSAGASASAGGGYGGGSSGSGSGSGGAYGAALNDAGMGSGSSGNASAPGIDPYSPLGKAMALANKAEQDRKLGKSALQKDPDTEMVSTLPPPGIEKLQYIKEHMGDADSIVDDGAHGKMAEDMRRQAMREAALSYGARGGLAKRSYEINERTRDFAHAMDQVFNFRSLLIKAPSGMLIEPPIVKETLENLLIEKNGSEAAMAQGVFDINKNAKIVSAPRDWRQYLVQPWTETIAPPPKTLWPRTDKEQMLWNTWVEQGWRAGLEQADKIFEMNTNRLTADYQGMVRYRVLLAQGMISAPYATLEERGVTGDDNQLRIGDTAIRITSPSQFIIGANTWRPADR